MWLTPMTCFYCSDMLPVRAAKDYSKLLTSDEEDSETPQVESYEKQQHLILKDLLEAGISSICTHYCTHCHQDRPLKFYFEGTYNDDRD